MRIFSLSHTRSSSTGNVGGSRRGFTLIELLISIGIIGILTAMVLVRYGTFDSTVLLKSTAYDIGLNIREAQVRSVSALRGQAGFDRPFGVSFDMSTPKAYTIFADANGSTRIPPIYEDGEDIQTIEIDRSMQIHSVCITRELISEICSDDDDVDRVDISYKRPEYRSLIYAEYNGTEIADVTDARIRVYSTRNPANVFEVVVSQLGQIDIKLHE